MTVHPKNQFDWSISIHELGKSFASLATQHDQSNRFVRENYDRLKQHRFFSAMIPEELGGAGISYTEMCHLIKEIAKYCGSTALAVAMHQHLVAASVWKYKNKGLAKETLEKVAKDQLILISTGAKDWLASNGSLEKVKGGYLFSAKKHFASQSEIGDIAVTSAPFLDEHQGWQVLHFPVPMRAKGVSLDRDWDVLGMRATGSQTIVFDQVFIPENSIALTRPRGAFHPVWNIVLGVAMPLIMSAYFGIAERARELVLLQAGDDTSPFLIGRLNNIYLAAKTQWKAMYSLSNNFDFQPNEAMSIEILSLKTNVAEACKKTVAEAIQIIGGRSFYKSHELERLFRDVQAAHFHPLPKWEQFKFTGEQLMKQQ